MDRARRPRAVHGRAPGGRRRGRGRRVVSAPRERGPRADGRAGRQRGLRVRAVRGRRRGRPSDGHGRPRPPAAAAGHDGGRRRAAELRPVHRDRRLVRPTGGRHAVSSTTR